MNHLVLVLSFVTYRKGVPHLSKIKEKWYIGDIYAAGDDKDITWSGIVDLTSEYTESIDLKSKSTETSYLNIPLWDSIPPTPIQIEQAASFLSERSKYGPVLVHCAHGVGRSTTVLVAGLVSAGEAENIEEAFNMVKQKRKIVKLNSKMQNALKQWKIIHEMNSEKN